jgi:hypothetical protein
MGLPISSPVASRLLALLSHFLSLRWACNGAAPHQSKTTSLSAKSKPISVMSEPSYCGMSCMRNRMWARLGGRGM